MSFSQLSKISALLLSSCVVVLLSFSHLFSFSHLSFSPFLIYSFLIECGGVQVVWVTGGERAYCVVWLTGAVDGAVLRVLTRELYLL